MRQRWISRLFKGMTAVILSIALAGSGLPETGIADRDNTNAMAAEIMGIDGDEYNIDEIDEESEIRDNVSNDSVSDAEDAATGLIQEYSNGLTTNEAESSDSPEEAITDQEAGKGEPEKDENKNQLGDNVFCRYEDEGKTLVIYGSGKMWDYGWKYNIRKGKMELVKNPPDFGGITRVLIESGVTTVGAYLFYQNKTLEKAELQDGLITINNDAFYECSNLKEVILPDSLTTIAIAGFWNCESLEKINLPNSLKEIGYSAFYRCTSLEEINLPEGMTSIEGFENCQNLKKVHLPESLTTIGSSAFWDCTSLEEINLPEGLKKIENYAFNNCTSLKEIHFPNSLTFMGIMPFLIVPLKRSRFLFWMN